ncbi:glycosyltransferase family 9 protein [Pantanalinema sp. GBBB05]|uniref:glycosyltransferase family 9 protein n=1 Tax=Pantanalinema sp. GBBB05 TaxID=2604139 RepID=UPI001DCBA073|nr:glycosyltransferase family 9 protein [Pantanalinema sp. GBBB05]
MNDPFLPGLLDRLPETPQKVVLVRASRIGDFVCATPAFRALRQALPQAEISLIAMPFVAELVARSPYLDRLIPFPGFPGMAEQFFAADRTLDFFHQMQAENFDLAIQMHGSGVYANPLTLMLGAQKTTGFIRPGDTAGCLDAALAMPENLHEIRRVLALINFLGVPSRGEQLEFPLELADHHVAESLLAQLKLPLIGLHPAAGDMNKQWSTDRFIQVGRALQQQCQGTVVVVGNQESWQLADQVTQGIGQGAVNLAGKTSLPVLGAVLDRLSVLITNDSGPAHIAYARQIPTVTLFGHTDPLTWGALHSTLQSRHRHLIAVTPTHQSVNLDSITVAQVLESAMSILFLNQGCLRSTS